MDSATFSPDLVCRPYRQLARNARLANARLDRACMALRRGEWEAPRTSFFPSLKETMIHLLNADRYYIDTLRGDLEGPSVPPGTRATPAEFAAERADVDDWLVDFSETLTIEALSRKINIPWPDRTLTETVADTLLHVFLHGQHHRGQIHSMLSGTSVPPPQIDEFILTDNGEARVEDLAALNWSEARLTR
ncbi:DinB family protein [Sinorhizobium americanum]|uniref:Putative damage-inducible protein DinB n=1 Tax=Sinorhizobium americanum TaxID=194963 RepID=A0A4R2C346_9HYPH|nr:DinB family protein [Sinorhizobium americanum]TCN33932.1 putative damage-inducible protein DinB [Sinorhizobium americanum]